MSVSGKCFKCSITVNALSMRKFGPAKEKEETWLFSFKCNLDKFIFKFFNIVKNYLLMEREG